MNKRIIDLFFILDNFRVIIVFLNDNRLFFNRENLILNISY